MPTDLEDIIGNGAPAPEPMKSETVPEPAPVEAAAPEAPDSETQADHDGRVPVAALQAERAKGKRYTEALADVERRLADQDQRWQQRFDHLIQQFAPQRQEAQPPATLWDASDPDEHIRSQAMQAVSPVMQMMGALARDAAEARHTPELVKEAEVEFNRLANAGQMDPAIHARINGSPNPYAAAVQWYQQTKAMAEIGSDPAAYKAKLEEEIRARVTAEMQQAPSGQASARPLAMPSNFATSRNAGLRGSGPAWSGPAPLDDILGQRR